MTAEEARELIGSVKGVELAARDEYVLENTDREKLRAAIEWLRKNEEVPQKHDEDGNETYQPDYPDELEDVTARFLEIFRNSYHAGKGKAIAYPGDPATRVVWLGTCASPETIVRYFIRMRRAENFSDGAFGSGVRDGLYLSMLLHIQDLMDYADALRILKETGN